MDNKQRREFDLLIVGSGISGLTTAITASRAGLNIAILSKEARLSECNTNYAQGGIVYRGEDDSPELLSQDILQAGDTLNNREAVQLLAEEGPALVKDFLIDEVGIPFCTNSNGKLDFTQEAAHSLRRIIHVKDNTGHVIEEKLLEYTKKIKNIHFFKSHCVIDLITNSHNSLDNQQRYKATRVIGAYVFDETTNQVEIFFAPSVVLATGGLGNLFLHTSNPTSATGDGVAMAYRIGAEIINAEYIQFHPTILYHRDVKRFLISESLRGEGARLMNKFGEYFLVKYNHELKDLAPRDEVSRAIFIEMEATDSDYVLLDTRLIKEVNIKKRFPSIYSQCKEIGINIAREPIPVVPAAHYFCGGIKVNLSCKTSIPGLYAVGENACIGVHGANRLASVSLLEGLFYGYKAGLDLAMNDYRIPKKLKQSIPDWIFPQPEEDFDPVLILQDLVNIRTTMWNYAGIVRNRKRLARALSDLNYLNHRVESFYRQAKITRKIIELRNGVLTATLIVRAALSNKTSRGCHYIE
jgi:L-aspartate oxidase